MALTVCLGLIIVLLLMYILYDKKTVHNGIYSIDSDYAKLADISSGLIYLDSGLDRDAYLYIKKNDGSVVEDQKINIKFRFGNVYVSGANNWPDQLKYKYSDKHQRLTIYLDDEVYFHGYKNHMLSD